MVAGSVLGHLEAVGNLRGGATLRKQIENLMLAWSEPRLRLS